MICSGNYFLYFCPAIAVSNPELHLPESEWNLIVEIVTALEPARNETKALQEDHLRLGDFQGIWLKCKLEITKMTSTEFGKLLLVCLKTHKLALPENNVFLAIIFLDPRYKNTAV